MAVDLTRWVFLAAIAAVRFNTSLKDVIAFGPSTIALLVTEPAVWGVLTIVGLFCLAGM